MKKFNNGHLAIIIIVCILVIDQIIKISVKTHMCLHDSIQITSWFYINFIENNGMAYGMTFVNKLVLSLFRIVAVGALGYYIWLEVKKGARTGYIVCVAMVLAGAAGNILDSMFYGLMFSASSPFYVSYVVPFGQGYAPFLMGKVVDMFYFPLIETTLPDWLPIWGGQPYVFFSPVFNFADASITTGVALLLLFFRKELSAISFKKDSRQNETSDENLK
ncbi:MAG: lipoprotein signal peptidase [Prevotella sp.]|jgi:signal peptidase II|nr:lipoprotein signal peptidase [Prevotella sp.]